MQNDQIFRAQMRRKQIKELPTVLSVKETAMFLNLPTQTVSRQCQNGMIPAVKIGKQWRITREAIEKLLGVSIA